MIIKATSKFFNNIMISFSLSVEFLETLYFLKNLEKLDTVLVLRFLIKFVVIILKLILYVYISFNI